MTKSAKQPEVTQQEQPPQAAHSPGELDRASAEPA